MILGKIIERAKSDCLTHGESEIKVNERITVKSKWEKWKDDERFKIMAMYFYINDIVAFSGQLSETICKC